MASKDRPKKARSSLYRLERDKVGDLFSVFPDEDGKSKLRVSFRRSWYSPPYDDRGEWDRDGQYFHYLTKWMHALGRMSEATGEARYCRWGVELAKAAHAGFRRTDPATGQVRLAWKMSIDLSRPLVPFSGLHDALDAWITYQSIAACAERSSVAARGRGRAKRRERERG